MQGLDRFAPALVQMWPYGGRPVTWPPKGGRLDFDRLDDLADAIVSIDDAQASPDAPTM